MPKLIDLTGKIFGHWNVIKQDMLSLGKGAFWICQCTCGTIKTIDGSFLRRGQTTHCGCQLKSLNLSNSQIYKIYSGIKQRCYNPKNSGYSYYGGRGIKMKLGYNPSWMMI